MQTVAPETTPFPRYDPTARYDVKTFDERARPSDHDDRQLHVRASQDVHGRHVQGQEEADSG